MNSDTLQFSDAEKQVLRDQYAQLEDHEFEAFLDAARRYQLNPLANQIYAQLRRYRDKNDQWQRRVTYVTGIDGYRLIADRTDAYAGNDDPVFDSEQSPNKATVTVYKLVGGQRCPFTATARWDQYYPGKQGGRMWDKMPHLMLGKVAEALALRKAFPADLSGIYTSEEMHQAERPVNPENSADGEPKQNRRPFEPDKAKGAESSPQSEQNDPKIADPKGFWEMSYHAGRETGYDPESIKTWLNTWLGECAADGISDTTVKQRQRFLAFMKGECESPIAEQQEQAA